MDSLDIDQYLQGITTTTPCGEDLEYDPSFQEMVRLAEGEPERQVGESIIPATEPNWQSIRKIALQLLNNTRDIQVAVYLTRAEMHLHGFYGLQQGLTLTHGLLVHFWDHIYPLQDPDDDYPVLRMNTISTLNDFNTFISFIRKIPLTDSRNFTISLQEIDSLSGKIRRPAEGDEPLSESQVKAAFMDSDPDFLRNNQEQISIALAEVQSMAALLDERVGAINAPDLSSLESTLKEIGSVFQEYVPHLLPDSGEIDVPKSLNSVSNESVPSEKHEGEVVMSNLNAINNREDVAKAIDLICNYYDLKEPASPVPLLLRRAKGLLKKDFLAVLEDLAPEGINQAMIVCGSMEHIENES